MARGTIVIFSQAKQDILNGIHNFGTHTFNIGLVTNATVPSAATAAPHWGGIGTTNFLSNQVGVAAEYTGPEAITGVSITGTDPYLVDTTFNRTWPQNPSGFTNASWGIIYNATDANKRAIGYIDLTNDGGATPVSLVDGDVRVDLTAGIFNVT